MRIKPELIVLVFLLIFIAVPRDQRRLRRPRGLGSDWEVPNCSLLIIGGTR